VIEPPKELEAWGVEQADGNEDNEDEELGWAIEQEKAEEDMAFHVIEHPKELEAWGVEQADGNEDNEDEKLRCSLNAKD